MAIIKRKQGTDRFQVKVRGSDGLWISRCFRTHSDAESFETEVRHRKHVNVSVTSQSRQILVRDYFGKWYDGRDNQTSAGWRRHPLHLYRAYVDSLIGELKLGSITPQLISQIPVEMARLGRSAQTRLHVFNLLRKMFGDAIEMFQLLTFNLVLRKLKPRVPIKEARHLNLNQIKQLLLHVRGRPCSPGIWVQLFLGLRIGELQALTWDDLDFETGTVHIRPLFC